eukprot:Rmarinus@m.13579
MDCPTCNRRVEHMVSTPCCDHLFCSDCVLHMKKCPNCGEFFSQAKQYDFNVQNASAPCTSSHVHDCVQVGNIDSLKVLLKTSNGIRDAHRGDATGKTPLHIAASRGFLQCAKLLVEVGDCDVNAIDDRGWTPLFCACFEGCDTVVHFLLDVPHLLLDPAGNVLDKYIVDLSHKDKDGWTALHTAAMRGHREICRMLVECGADCMTRDANGLTASDVARDMGFFPISDLLLPEGDARPLSRTAFDHSDELSYALRVAEEAEVALRNQELSSDAWGGCEPSDESSSPAALAASMLSVRESKIDEIPEASAVSTFDSSHVSSPSTPTNATNTDRHFLARVQNAREVSKRGRRLVLPKRPAPLKSKNNDATGSPGDNLVVPSPPVSPMQQPKKPSENVRGRSGGGKLPSSARAMCATEEGTSDNDQGRWDGKPPPMGTFDPMCKLCACVLVRSLPMKEAAQKYHSLLIAHARQTMPDPSHAAHEANNDTEGENTLFESKSANSSRRSSTSSKRRGKRKGCASFLKIFRCRCFRATEETNVVEKFGTESPEEAEPLKGESDDRPKNDEDNNVSTSNVMADMIGDTTPPRQSTPRSAKSDVMEGTPMSGASMKTSTIRGVSARSSPGGTIKQSRTEKQLCALEDAVFSIFSDLLWDGYIASPHVDSVSEFFIRLDSSLDTILRLKKRTRKNVELEEYRRRNFLLLLNELRQYQKLVVTGGFGAVTETHASFSRIVHVLHDMRQTEKPKKEDIVKNEPPTQSPTKTPKKAGTVVNDSDDVTPGAFNDPVVKKLFHFEKEMKHVLDQVLESLAEAAAGRLDEANRLLGLADSSLLSLGFADEQKLEFEICWPRVEIQRLRKSVDLYVRMTEAVTAVKKFYDKHGFDCDDTRKLEAAAQFETSRVGTSFQKLVNLLDTFKDLGYQIGAAMLSGSHPDDDVLAAVKDGQLNFQPIRDALKKCTLLTEQHLDMYMKFALCMSRQLPNPTVLQRVLKKARGKGKADYEVDVVCTKASLTFQALEDAAECYTTFMADKTELFVSVELALDHIEERYTEIFKKTRKKKKR